jgi:hypothetical protein
MSKISDLIKQSQQEFKSLLSQIATNGGLTKERYIRFLNMQYHLTNGVQKHFFALAANSNLGKKPGLRDWLLQFGKEEEHHYLVAASDLKELGEKVDECPLDVKLWWLYFDSILPTHPFQRLGATCILENISSGSVDVLDGLIQKSGFLTPRNLKFLTIHRHGPNLDHGNQIVAALEKADLDQSEWDDVLLGAEIATLLYLRLSRWVISGKEG